MRILIGFIVMQNHGTDAGNPKVSDDSYRRNNGLLLTDIRYAHSERLMISSSSLSS